MSNTPETEVIRIEGNVTIVKGDLNVFKEMFKCFTFRNKYQWSGSIVPQDDETGMRLYPVEVVESYQRLNRDYELQILQLRQTKSENDKAFLSLSEELSKERESKEFDRQLDLAIIQGQKEVIIDQYNKIKALKKRLESKENTCCRTFTKWWKELWKRK